MDILETLERSGKELYPEDLDFFETELDTGGGYSAEYRSRCRELIEKLRNWMKNGEQSEQPDEALPQETDSIPGKLIVGLADVTPDLPEQPEASDKPIHEIIFADINNMRERSTYKSDFKSYAAAHETIDADFIEKYFSLFRPWELDAILTVRQLGEEFLEKYFGALDKDIIARYQLFSEQFYMKHFSQLNATIVLQCGKNDWRKKDSRSKQLDVFLRLKGIKI